MLDNRACPLCGGHLDWMKVGARELYRCGSCVWQMSEQEVLDYRREGASCSEPEARNLCETCAHKDRFWSGGGCNLKANGESCSWEGYGRPKGRLDDGCQ